MDVLNLIINGIPSIPSSMVIPLISVFVLNLIINGIPSIHNKGEMKMKKIFKF